MLYLFATATLMLFAWSVVTYVICLLTPLWRDAWARGDKGGALKVMLTAFASFILLMFYEVMMTSTLF